MHPDLDQLLADRGFLTRPEVLEHGLDDRVLTAAVRDGALLRIGVGLYAPPEHAGLRPEDQHAVRCHAVATRFDGMLKHQTGHDLAHEKVREDAIRRLGWGMTRIIWPQLAGARRRVVAAELRAGMEQSRRQFGHLAA